MGRIVIGVRQDYRCKLSGIPTATESDAKDCATCGWNPEVNRRRRAELYRYAKEKRLQEWGVAEGNDEKSNSDKENMCDAGLLLPDLLGKAVEHIIKER